MRRLLTTALLLSCIDAHADEAWRCRTSNGHEYTASQKVPSDKCHRIKVPPTTSPPAVLRADNLLLCKNNPRAKCNKIGSDFETGEFNGAAYRIGSDAAGVAAMWGADPGFAGSKTRWDINCDRDVMNGVRSCVVSYADIYIIFRPKQVYVFVGREHTPGTTTSIKAGTQRFDTVDRNGQFADSKSILSSMKDGQTVITRYTKWPERGWTDNQITLYGAEGAIAIGQWLVDHPSK